MHSPLLVVSLLFCFSDAFPKKDITCPDGTFDSEFNKCYKEYQDEKTWAQAELTCVKNGGHLVSITSAIENYVLVNDFISILNDHYWIGGTSNRNNTFIWSDHSNFTYTNWVPGYPIKGAGNCLIQRVDNGRWENTNCSEQRSFACEYLPLNGTLPQACPNSSWTYNSETNKCYFVGPSQPSWHDANQACHNLHKNAALVSIHSYEENFFIFLLYDVTFGAKAAWIGLHAKEENAPYMWTDMTPLDFVYWEADIFSPNPDGDPCVYRDFSVDVYGRGDWIAYNCSDPSITGYGYVCQLSF